MQKTAVSVVTDHCKSFNISSLEKDAITSQAIVFVDAAVDDLNTLVNGVISGTEVIILDPKQDGIKQITDALKDREGFDTVHILSHGSPGCLYLGNSELSLSTLTDYLTDLQSWFTFSPNSPGGPSLMLYGCNVAAGNVGSEFVEKLYQIVQSPVYATRTKTGNIALGGNWQLEVSLGTDRAFPSIPFTPQMLITYRGLFLEVKFVKNIKPSSDPYSLELFAGVDGKLFFSGNDGSTGRELWVSDGTTAGTHLVKDITPGNGGSLLGNFTEADGKLFFGRYNSTGRELWISDGTTAGTQLVKDVNPNNSAYFKFDFIEVNSHLFFVVDDSNTGRELWTSDSTTEGTRLVKDIFPGSSGSHPGNFIGFGEKLFFTAFDSSYGRELWASDGTTAGTRLVKDIYPGSATSNPELLMEFNGQLLFEAVDGSSGRELWVSDGTLEGTHILKDINPGEGSSETQHFTEVDGKLFFTANNGIIPTGLWVSDGTTAGTQLVRDIPTPKRPRVGNYSPSNFTEVNGKLFFTTSTDSLTDQLWTSDGTAAGTHLVKEIYSSISSPGDSSPKSFTEFNGQVVFTADESSTGRELWISDGTAGGTHILKDINPGSDSSFPYGFRDTLTEFNGQLVFLADDGSTGRELWISDGTTAGTQLVRDIRSGTGGSHPTNFTKLDGQLFFTTNGPGYDGDLWVMPNFLNTISGNKNSNFLKGTSGDDLIDGLGGADTLIGKAGDDILNGGGGRDQLQGQGGDDILNGGDGGDELSGNGGDDILNGGAGRDSLRGGGGHDTFVLAVNQGQDIIRDFTKGMDYLSVFDGLSFNDLDILGRGDDTLIRYNGSTLARLSNVSAATIGLEDFIFETVRCE